MEISKEQKEAIEELEEFIKGPCETCKYCEAAYKLNRKNIIQLLNLTKKLQKENEELKAIYRSEKKMKNEYIKLYQDLLLKENVIPVQKVKDKIEELNKAYEDSKDENGEGEYYYPDYTIRVLEELLESE